MINLDDLKGPDGFESLSRYVNETIRAELVQKELKMLRAVVWIVARENGGGLTIPRRHLEMVPEEAVLDAWLEAKDGTAHIRALGKPKV